MVNILLEMKADPLIGGACDRIYEPIEEDRARAILAFHGFKQVAEEGLWIKKVNGAILSKARLRKAQEFRSLLQFPN